MPPSGATPYEFRLRVTGSNPYTNDTPLFVHVDNSGFGQALFVALKRRFAFGIAGGGGGGLKRLFMTHPPLEERIAALRAVQ